MTQKSVDSYLSGDGKFSIEVYKNKTAWNESLNKELSNGKTETEVIKIKSDEVQVFHDSNSSKTFFEVNNSYIIVGWGTNTLDKEMKAILESFN